MFPVKQPISEIESFSTRPRRRVYLNIGICTANFPGRIWLPRTTLAAAQPTSHDARPTSQGAFGCRGQRLRARSQLPKAHGQLPNILFRGA